MGQATDVGGSSTLVFDNHFSLTLVCSNSYALLCWYDPRRGPAGFTLCRNLRPWETEFLDPVDSPLASLWRDITLPVHIFFRKNSYSASIEMSVVRKTAILGTRESGPSGAIVWAVRMRGCIERMSDDGNSLLVAYSYFHARGYIMYRLQRTIVDWLSQHVPLHDSCHVRLEHTSLCRFADPGSQYRAWFFLGYITTMSNDYTVYIL